MCSPSTRAGLPVLLHQEDVGLANLVQGHKNTDVFDDSRDETLHHVFGLASGSMSFLSDDGNNPVDCEKIAAFLVMGLMKHRSDGGTNHRDGIEIIKLHGSDDGGIDDAEGFVTINKMSGAGDMKVFQRRRRGGGGAGLVIESQDAFCSVRANARVSRGKWMYEVTLETSGIQQIGWATQKCRFTREEGVGDSQDSYAYDGKRVKKWCVSCHSYGQPWVQGDVIGCFINLEEAEVSFSRNGISLGIAFAGVGILPYYPAISLSQGERCDLNFGGRPFRYPREGFQPIQAPLVVDDGMHAFHVLPGAQFLFTCLRKLLQLDSNANIASMSPIKRLKRPKPLNRESTTLVAREICRRIACLLMLDSHAFEYVIWGALVPFLVELHRLQPPHDVACVEFALETIFFFLDSRIVCGCICEIMEALAFSCRTSSINLVDSPYTGSYPYLAIAAQLMQRRDYLMYWCSSETFDLCLEGLFSRKTPSKYDLEKLMPIVWWTGSREELCTETTMRQNSQALSKAISKVEDLQWEISHYLLGFVPLKEKDLSADSMFVKMNVMNPSESVFVSFLRHLVCKNKGATKNIPPPGLSDNSVLMAVYTVLLRFLSEGYINTMAKDEGSIVGFLHRGGSRRFSIQLFLDVDSYISDFTRLGGTLSHLLKTHNLTSSDCNEMVWEEGCMEDESERKITHQGRQKPCCCTGTFGQSSCSKGPVRVLDKGFNMNRADESNETEMSDHCRRNICTANEEENASFSGRVQSISRISPHHQHNSQKGNFDFEAFSNCDVVHEDELLDIMVVLYHLGVASNFKQASYFLQRQLQISTQLDETERRIRGETTSNEQLKQFKEARSVYKGDLTDIVRQSTWYKVLLFTKWKQRGMFATCMWIVQLLIMLSNKDPLFSFVPEYYIETLLDCFHALRRSDPLFVSPTALLQQGLSPLAIFTILSAIMPSDKCHEQREFNRLLDKLRVVSFYITFLVTHFNDTRIANLDIRDALLQSISVLVQYKEHVVAFESNSAATSIMPAALLSSFDNRFWIPVTNILLRLCKGTGFGCSKSSAHGESCSVFFQNLLKEKCMGDEKLFSSFLNRLFNTLNWTITEFSVSIRDMREQSDRHQQVTDLQQRKCSIMFELSCNLERVLEFFTRELPAAFLCGPEINLVRLCELMMFVLSHTASIDDAIFFERNSLRKVNKALILAPIVGMALNLSTTQVSNQHPRHDLALTLLKTGVKAEAASNFESLLNVNWAMTFKGDPSLARLPNLQGFVAKLKDIAAANEREHEDDFFATIYDYDHGNCSGDESEEICSICCTCEINTVFSPCNHRSCSRCISRHLLNNQRCFFCNATIGDLYSLSAAHSPRDHDEVIHVGQSSPLMKMGSS